MIKFMRVGTIGVYKVEKEVYKYVDEEYLEHLGFIRISWADATKDIYVKKWEVMPTTGEAALLAKMCKLKNGEEVKAVMKEKGEKMKVGEEEYIKGLWADRDCPQWLPAEVKLMLPYAYSGAMDCDVYMFKGGLYIEEEGLNLITQVGTVNELEETLQKWGFFELEKP